MIRDPITLLEDTAHPSLCRKLNVRVPISGWFVHGGLVQYEPPIVDVIK